ncbi:hypothetical protein ABK040_004442 [Willaertia magna]
MSSNGAANNTDNKKPLREKYVVLYESIFNYKDPMNKPLEKDEQFWDELFLLKINSGYLENSILLQSEEELISIEQTVMNPLCFKCLSYMNDSSSIRRANAIQTLCILFKALFTKKWNNFSIRILSLICGFQNADEFFKMLLSRGCSILLKGKEEEDKRVRQMVLALFVILLTGADNINQNAIIDYFTIVDIFEALIYVIEDKYSYSIKMKKNAIICLATLCNYRKYELLDNIYLNHLKNLQKPSSMLALAEMTTKFLFIWNDSFQNVVIEEEGLISYVWTSIFGSTTNDETKKARSVNEISGSLLIFYELIKSNKDFVGSITRSLAQQVVSENNNITNNNNSNNSLKSIKEHLTEMQNTKLIRGCPLILQEFLKFSSVLFQEPYYTTKYVMKVNNSKTGSDDIASQYYTHFCLLVILCLLEKKVFIKYIFDINTKLDFYLFKKEKGIFTKKQFNGYGTIAKIIMELLIDFIFHHLQRKHFPIDLSIRALSAIHLLICYSRKYRVRFAVDWDTLWKSLTMICDIIGKDNCNKEKEKASNLLERVLSIFNLGILKGEAFLPTRRHHEQMIYHFIRTSSVFDLLTDWMERNLKKVNVNRQLILNINTIIVDIGNEIDIKFGSYPSEDQVFGIIKHVYPNLKFVEFQTLETVEEYTENPNEITFFSQLIKLFVFDCKQLVHHSFLNQKNQ